MKAGALIKRKRVITTCSKKKKAGLSTSLAFGDYILIKKSFLHSLYQPLLSQVY